MSRFSLAEEGRDSDTWATLVLGTYAAAVTPYADRYLLKYAASADAVIGVFLHSRVRTVLRVVRGTYFSVVMEVTSAMVLMLIVARPAEKAETAVRVRRTSAMTVLLRIWLNMVFMMDSLYVVSVF
jgi:hypothetical protein